MHTHTTAEHTNARQQNKPLTNTERATAQRRLIFEGVVAAPKIFAVRECEHNEPDSLDARLFPSVVFSVAPAVTMNEASSLSI